MGTNHRHGLLSTLRRQGAVALVLALVFVFGAAAQAYARGLAGPDEEMCRSAVSQSQTQTSNGANAPLRHDGSCCDVCVCAFPVGLPAAALRLRRRRARRGARGAPSGARVRCRSGARAACGCAILPLSERANRQRRRPVPDARINRHAPAFPAM
jgi:hypothetical protein